MKRLFQSGAGAALLWVASSLVVASVIAPWVYQGGKSLAAATAAGDFPTLIEWLGAACGKAKFGRFYSRSLVFSAIVLMPFLIARIRKLREAEPLEMHELFPFNGSRRAMQTVVGWVIGVGFLSALAVTLHFVGAYSRDPLQPAVKAFLTGALVPSIAAPLLEETLFRGLIFGLCLRSARPLTACVGSSLLFAFLHFLEPPAGFTISNPGSPFAGFELLGSILFHFADPKFFVTDFATLFVAGMILAWARWRTGALWFPIGLHAGWVLAFKCSSLLLREAENNPLQPWCLGESVRSGLLPLLVLGLTALACHFAMRCFPARQTA